MKAGAPCVRMLILSAAVFSASSVGAWAPSVRTGLSKNLRIVIRGAGGLRCSRGTVDVATRRQATTLFRAPAESMFLSRSRAVPSAHCLGTHGLRSRMAAATRTDYDAEQLRLLDSDECILVDKGDNVIGHGSKKFCHLMENISADKALHRAFSVFLFNTEGKLLLQKRSEDKILFPNRWTNTCCSHPLYNPEEMDDPASPDARGVRIATVRKLEHELGIAMGSVPAESMHYMTRIVYKAAVGEDDKWGEHEVDYILLAVADVECKLNTNEVSEIRYVGKEELAELLAQEQRQEIMLSPWFKAVAQRWLPIWWDALLAGNLDSVKDTDTIHMLA
jgi:isopentenyl-diphosphate delta-isomerase